MHRKLSGIDLNFWTLDTDTTQQVIGCYCPLGSLPDRAKLRAAFAALTERFPRLRERVSGGLFWEAVPLFDIDRYVTFESVLEARSPRDLLPAVSRIFSERLPHDAPLWRFTVLHGTEPCGPAGALFRVHHAMADGLGGLELLYAVADTPPVREGARSGRRSHVPPGARRIAGSLLHLFRESFLHRNGTPINGHNSAARTLTVADVPLGTLMASKELLGCSLNDMFLTSVAAAISRYVRTFDGPDEVTAIVPASLRRPSASEALGNHLTGVGIPLPVAETGVLHRLNLVRERMKITKSNGSFGAYALLGTILAHLPPRMRLHAGERAARRTHLICTNMQGPTAPYSIAGSTVLAQYGMPALLFAQGLAFSFITYDSAVSISLVSDPAVIDDPDEVLRDVVRSLAELSKNLEVLAEPERARSQA